MQLIEKGNDGYKVISDNNREYDLLEGYTIKGDKASDILFVFDYGVNDENTEIANKTPALVSWCFGADVTDNTLAYIKRVISEYEEKLGLKAKDYKVIKEF